MTYSQAMLNETIAKQQMHDCLMRHSHGIDRCNVAVLKSAYWEDATVSYGMFEGKAHEFCDFLMPGLAPFQCTQHGLLNIWIEMLSETTAKAECYVHAYHHIEMEGSAGQDMMVGGRYLDKFERRGDIWKMSHRTYVMDWNSNTAATTQWEGDLYGQLKTRGARHPNDPYDGFGS